MVIKLRANKKSKLYLWNSGEDGREVENVSGRVGFPSLSNKNIGCTSAAGKIRYIYFPLFFPAKYSYKPWSLHVKTNIRRL